MSKIDSRKELNSVYRRCLSALNRSFRINQPSAEKCRMMEAAVAEEALKKVFVSPKERENWIRNRYDELYHEEQSRLFKDPLANLKARIRSMMDESV